MLFRPHHGLCTQFYEGKGYSQDFTNQMDAVMNAIASNKELTITLHSDTDILCEHCPNNVHGSCKTYEKVADYDQAVLAYCQLKNGDTIPISSFLSNVRQEIINKNRLKDICSDCTWYHICSSKVVLDK